jgi:antitoxin component YwqK of YwqJK toxin-antitoxin module
MQGLYRRWYENGVLAEEIPMCKGKIEGVGHSYFESGYLKTELTIHDGKVVKQISWPDGTRAGDADR